MYRCVLCRNHIFLGSFGSLALFSTTSAAILNKMVDSEDHSVK